MNSENLLQKYLSLAAENESLRKENERLREILRDILPSHDSENVMCQRSTEVVAQSEDYAPVEVHVPASTPMPEIEPQEKIKLFKSLFAGRDDVYAKRWQNKKGESGYSPVCRNEWKTRICHKPRIKCSQCEHREYDKLTDQVIEDHLRGKAVLGTYALLPDETCRFLAIDFDKEGWQGDVTTFRSVCSSFDIPVAVERSRSGNGAHVWFFFKNPIAASAARKFGSALITHAMNKNHGIPFTSYDRLFPNQDTLPKGGLGNLIALPLQKQARYNCNSVFIDENFEPYNHQWEYLSAISRISEETVVSLTMRLCGPDELGDLRRDDEEIEKPWEQKRQVRLTAQDFPSALTLVRANMIFIPKAGISPKGLNALKRLAAFKNPDFYKTQAMRLSTYGKPRIISCCDETDDYLCLPRGCEPEMLSLLADTGVKAVCLDKTQKGRMIEVEFKGRLRNEQQEAIEEMLKHDSGVLSATTAFGKTVIAAKIIAERKVNTLILVHRQQLLEQWNDRLEDFLNINEVLPPLEKNVEAKKCNTWLA